eukprot:6204145-Pleurochrysis_carterae.AAC.9
MLDAKCLLSAHGHAASAHSAYIYQAVETGHLYFSGFPCGSAHPDTFCLLFPLPPCPPFNPLL